MKTKSILAFLFMYLIVIVIGMPVLAQSSETNNVPKWLVDTSHSNVSFTVNHLYTPVLGTFDSYSSNIFFDPDNLSQSSIEVEIDVSSINTRNERRDNDLRSDNFFEVENHPSIIFKSNSIERVGENDFVAKGTISIKDITKEIELPFKLLGMSDHYRLEGYKMAGITAQISLYRTDFNIGTGDWMRTNIVGNEVNVSIALELATKTS